MSSVIEHAIREPEVGSAHAYTRRTHRLALAYSGLFFLSAVGIGLIIWRAQLFVILTQRSNVETLTLAFFLVFFAYLMLLSLGGAYGAARIGWYALRARLGLSWLEVERRKTRALAVPASAHVAPATVALNVALDLEGQPHRPFTIPIEDEAGSLGELVVDGAEMTHTPTFRDGSNAALAYAVEQINEMLVTRGAQAGIQIVEWRKIDDEATDQYLGLVRFARNLERHLGTSELWPRRIITQGEYAELRARFTAVCAAMRNEAFLPHWEYEGEHKLPLIPEPLGLISLSRTERRVDPLSSMGCAVAIVAVTVLVLILLIIWPPWVPGV